jgi:hypothetical protein
MESSCEAEGSQRERQTWSEQLVTGNGQSFGVRAMQWICPASNIAASPPYAAIEIGVARPVAPDDLEHFGVVGRRLPGTRTRPRRGLSRGRVQILLGVTCNAWMLVGERGDPAPVAPSPAVVRSRLVPAVMLATFA